MTRPGRYPQELRERAVRLVFRGILAAFGTTITQARLAYPEQAVLVMGCNSVSRAPGTARSTRDEPVNLSGSRLRTHQHLAPAGATCCYSLLLDPDATIGIDLHKRLFLLVTGRGE